MKTLKKSLALILALAMCLGLCAVPAFAEASGNVITNTDDDLAKAWTAPTQSVTSGSKTVSFDYAPYSHYSDLSEGNFFIAKFTKDEIYSNSGYLKIQFVNSGSTEIAGNVGQFYKSSYKSNNNPAISLFNEKWTPILTNISAKQTYSVSVDPSGSYTAGNTHTFVSRSWISGEDDFYAIGFRLTSQITQDTQVTINLLDTDNVLLASRDYTFSSSAPVGEATPVSAIDVQGFGNADEFLHSYTNEYRHQELYLRAIVTGGNGTEVPTWTTSNPAVTLIETVGAARARGVNVGSTPLDTDVYITIVGCGEATITAAIGDVSGTYVITINPEDVAQVGETKYTTLAAAIENAQDGDTVTLLTNVTLDSTVDIDKSLTLNLNGKTITALDVRALHVQEGAVEITGIGTISANKVTANSAFGDSSSVIRVGDDKGTSASLTIGSGVTVSSNHCYGVTVFGKDTNGQSLTVNGKVIVTGTAAAISGNGRSELTPTTITINDGAVVSASNSAAIYHPEGGHLTVNGGTLSGKGYGVLLRGGTMSMTGGAISIVDEQVTVGDANTTPATGTVIYDMAANYPYMVTDQVPVLISGGHFSKEPAAEYLAAGYVAVRASDGYDVVPSSDGVVATIGTRQYSTLAAAFADATNGATIKLEKDVSLTETLTIEKAGCAITLDLGTYTLDGRVNLKGGDLTVKNGKVTGSQPLNVYGAENSSANVASLTIASDVTVNNDGDDKNSVVLFPTYHGATPTYYGYGAKIDIYGTVNGTVFVSGNLGNDAASGAALAASKNISVITVHNGAKVVNAADQGVAMNGMAKVIIEDGATITGREAIGLKRGELIVNGGTMKATGTTVASIEANNNGTEKAGAALSITSTYNYAGAIKATVTGGTFTSDHGVAVLASESVKNGQKNSFTEGNPIISISGGTFSSKPENSFIASGYAAIKSGDNYVVKEIEIENETDGTYTLKAKDDTGSSLTVTVQQATGATTLVTTSDVKAENINLAAVVGDSVDMNVESGQNKKVDVELSLSVTDTTAQQSTTSENTVSYEVHPEAKITTTVTDSNNTQVSQTVKEGQKVTNDQLAANASFRLTVQAPSGAEYAKIVHSGRSDGKADETFHAQVVGGKVSVTLRDFSTLTLTGETYEDYVAGIQAVETAADDATYTVAAVANVTPEAGGSTKYVTPEQTFTVDITYSGYNSYGADIDLTYDPAKVSYVSSSSNLYDGFEIEAPTTPNGTLKLIRKTTGTSNGAATALTSGATIATLKFTVLDKDSVSNDATANFGFSRAQVSIPGNKEKTATMTDDTITIRNLVTVTVSGDGADGLTASETIPYGQSALYTNSGTLQDYATNKLGYDYTATASPAQGTVTITGGGKLTVTAPTGGFKTDFTVTVTKAAKEFEVTLNKVHNLSTGDNNTEPLTGSAEKATYNQEYTVTIPKYYPGLYDYVATYQVGGGAAVTRTITAGTGNTGTFTIPGNVITGPITVNVTKTSKMVVNVYDEYVTGWTLVTVKGGASSYTLEGKAMYRDDLYKADLMDDEVANGWNVFAYLVKGTVDVAAVTPKITALTTAVANDHVVDAPEGKGRYNIDRVYDGTDDETKAGYNDVITSYNGYNVIMGYDVTTGAYDDNTVVYNMRTYLRADVAKATTTTVDSSTVTDVVKTASDHKLDSNDTSTIIEAYKGLIPTQG